MQPTFNYRQIEQIEGKYLDTRDDKKSNNEILGLLITQHKNNSSEVQITRRPKAQPE